VTAIIGPSPDDEAGPPRRNGELVFEAPWEGRLFGLTLALAERGWFGWDEFRALLVEETAADDAAERAGGSARAYYVRWERALERLLSDLGTLSGAEIDSAPAVDDDHHRVPASGSSGERPDTRSRGHRDSRTA
jgi:nitrile hydratase accessory protein